MTTEFPFGLKQEDAIESIVAAHPNMNSQVREGLYKKYIEISNLVDNYLKNGKTHHEIYLLLEDRKSKLRSKIESPLPRKQMAEIFLDLVLTNTFIKILKDEKPEEKQRVV